MLGDNDLGGMDLNELYDMADEIITDETDFDMDQNLDQSSTDATNQARYESGLITPEDL